MTTAAGLLTPRVGVPGGVPVLSTLVRSGLGRVFGPPPFDLAAYPGDPGLLGPDSASWRIIGDPAAIVGGVRALLVQLLHPLAMAGVADHSRFRADALGRLRATSAYVVTSTFGAVPEVLDAARLVRGRHRRVVGTAPDGRGYRADDPHLLVWVSIALTSSFLEAYRAYGARTVTTTEADAFVAEQSRIAALLDPRVDLDGLDLGALDQLPLLVDGLLPLTSGALDSTVAAYRPELRVEAQGREALRFLMWPDIGVLRAAYLPVLAGAVVSLPSWQRRLLGVRVPRPIVTATRMQTRAGVAALRLATGASPSVAAARARVDRGVGPNEMPAREAERSSQ